MSKMYFALISKLLWVWCSPWKPKQDCSWNVRFLGFLCVQTTCPTRNSSVELYILVGKQIWPILLTHEYVQFYPTNPCGAGGLDTKKT